MSRLSSVDILHTVATSYSPSQRHTMQVFWDGMKIVCFHSDGTITPLTAREKCSIQASRITTKLHETSHGASHDISVDGVRWTYRLELVLRWTNESSTSLRQADNRHCLKRGLITGQWRLNCCYWFRSRMMHGARLHWACVSRQRANTACELHQTCFHPHAFF